MKVLKEQTRREFLVQSSVLGLGLQIPTAGLSLFRKVGKKPTEELNISVFSKCLQFLDYKSMCEASREMGFDGVDLTIRRKGHVLPERVSDDLPLAVEAMRSFGLEPNLFSSNIADAADPIDRQVLELTSKLGFQQYRTAWFKYKSDKDIIKTVENAGMQLKDLAMLNKELELVGVYQNHSGHYFGAGIWDLYSVLKEIPSSHLGSQYDIMHATAEAGRSWEIDFQLIKPFIKSIALKDFIWAKKDGQWKVQYVPIGEGMVDFARFFSLLKEHNIVVPMTIHVEYDLGGAEHGKKSTMKQEKILEHIKKDLQFVRETYKTAQ